MTQALYYLDPELKGRGGHYFEYARSIVECCHSKTINTVIACNKNADHREMSGVEFVSIFSHGMWDRLPNHSYDSSENITQIGHQFIAEAEELFQQFLPKSQDVIFFPNLTKLHLFAAAKLAQKYYINDVKIVLFLRYPASFYDGEICAQAFRMLEAINAPSVVTIATDSHRLEREYRKLTSLPVVIFPIPHAQTNQDPRRGANSDEIHVVSLGNARSEKGIVQIINAANLAVRTVGLERLTFTIQINNPDHCREDIDHLTHDHHPKIQYIRHTASSSDYYGLLDRADIVLTPYDPVVYRARSSGIFLEGLLSGKVNICTNHTWMSDILKLHQGGIVIKNNSSQKILQALHTIVQDFSVFDQNAKAAQDYWKPIHSSENFVSYLMGNKSEQIDLPSFPDQGGHFELLPRWLRQYFI